MCAVPTCGRQAARTGPPGELRSVASPLRALTPLTGLVAHWLVRLAVAAAVVRESLLAAVRCCFALGMSKVGVREL